MNRREFKLVCALFLLDPQAAKTAEPPPLQPAEFADSYRNDIPVGGSIVVGAIAIERGNRIRAGRLVVNALDMSSRTICLTISSRDGRYSAAGRYTLPAGASGLQSLVLKPKHETELFSYTQDQVSVLVNAAENCSGPTVFVLSARWSDGSASAKPSLFLNSQGADSEVRRTDAPQNAVSCSRIPGGANVSFDSECDVSSLLGNGVTSLSINRTRFDSVYPPIRLRFTKP